MTNKQKILIIVLIFGSGVAIGRFTVPTKTVEITQSTELSKTKENKNETTNRDKEVTTTVVEEVKPDGTKKTITKKVESTKTAKKDQSTTVASEDKTDATKKEVTKDSGHITISALAMANLTSPTLTWGAQVQAPLIGPFVIGAFGFMNGNVGFSLGLSF